MDKDRDISRTISTPIKVGFVGSAVLAGAAIAAACGGGSSKSANTPEDGVGGVARQPGGGASPIVVETAGMPSATAVREAPTEAPTATVEAQLTQADINRIGEDVQKGVDEILSVGGINPNTLPDSKYADEAYINQRIVNCTQKVGQAFEQLPGIIIEPSNPNYWKLMNIQCQQIAEATKALAKGGDETARQLNQAWKSVHKSVFDQAVAAGKFSASAWANIEASYYVQG